MFIANCLVNIKKHTLDLNFSGFYIINITSKILFFRYVLIEINFLFDSNKSRKTRTNRAAHAKAILEIKSKTVPVRNIRYGGLGDIINIKPLFTQQ